MLSLQELHPTHNILQPHLQEPEFFLVHKWRVSQETRLVNELTPTSLFLRGSQKQKQYQERNTLRTWGVLQRALQVSQPGYSALTWRHEHKPQEPQRWLQEGDSEQSAPINMHHTHCTPRQLGTSVAWRYDISRDWIWDACHKAGVCWGTRCKGFCTKEGLHYCFEQSVRDPLERDQVRITLGICPEAVIGQATINLIHEFGTPLRIPYPSCIALLSGAYVMRESWAWGFLWVRKVWFTFAQQMFSPETFSERRKGERSQVVSLLPGFLEHLALRNPRILCQKHVGTCTTYYLKVPKVQEMGQEIGFPCSQERREEISK